MPFFQDGPVLSNLFTQDSWLTATVEKFLPASVYTEHEPLLRELGKISAQCVKLQVESDQNPPQLTHFDPWGLRIDNIQTAKHWDLFRELAIKWQIVGKGHDKQLGSHARVLQTAYMMLFSPTTATYLCPLAMSDAAACVVNRLAPKAVKDRLYPRLISGDVSNAITSGQWMTERPGGSDVSQTETVAVFDKMVGEEPQYRLSGTKWFTSSITSEMALLLAQVEGAQKGKALTLFCWERLESGLCSDAGVRVLRLKDKLGTRSLPTAEIELNGAIATQLGEIGRGTSHISEMLNITRFYNAVASAASMNFSSLLVEDYAKRRKAFGKPIGEHAMMRGVVQNLQIESRRATTLCFEVARLLGLCEVGEAKKEQQLCMRAIVPLAKLALGKAAVAHASETLECFGGAGYIEDTGLPRILRDAQVFPIWEGTTNILALDIWRSEKKEGALSALIQSMIERDQTSEMARQLLERAERMKEIREEEALPGLRSLVFDTSDLLQKQLASY